MQEQTKRRLALFALAFFAMAPLFLFGLTGLRWRIWWTPPGLPGPWPLPIPLLTPDTAA